MTSIDDPPPGSIMTRSGVATTPGGCMTTDPNPMQALLRRHLGVDAFALDGDATETLHDWSEKRRKIKLELDPVHQN